MTASSGAAIVITNFFDPIVSAVSDNLGTIMLAGAGLFAAYWVYRKVKKFIK